MRARTSRAFAQSCRSETTICPKFVYIFRTFAGTIDKGTPMRTLHIRFVLAEEERGEGEGVLHRLDREVRWLGGRSGLNDRVELGRGCR